VPVSLAQIEDVYRRRGADFFRFALARTGDPEGARDAVQEGFARAIRSRSSVRASDSLEPWLARCVINAAHDVARDAARRSDVHEVDTAREPDLLEPSLVRDAVRRLPPRQRDALFLRHYLGFAYDAIAETLGMELGTVSATLHAARAALADSLEEVAR
jgi:RNA polymerase sigma-70 factor (ECF subfamily)